jgi:hypothetical protein
MASAGFEPANLVMAQLRLRGTFYALDLVYSSRAEILIQNPIINPLMRI